MRYGQKFNLFFKSNAEIVNEEKIKTLKQYSRGDMLALLRNIEESPDEYEEEIIKAVAVCLFDKGIICM